ncbi:MAG: TetR/AcrR family transcriptional regulator [Spirochaetes bacterium]|nr:MAG: TetR/AcrR family transcriptional regulator [Spirochaetota bacterium]
MSGDRAKRDTRVPVQKRGIRTRERILKAAERLFAKKGYHGTNSNEIAAAAGVSTGSFYAYFPDKKLLFLETLRKYNQDVREKIMEGTREGEPPAEPDAGRALIRRLIGRALAAHEFSPAFHREATAMIFTDTDTFKLQAGEDARIIDALASSLALYADSFGIRDTRSAALVIFRATEGVIHHLRMHDEGERESVLEELAVMLERYLLPV